MSLRELADRTGVSNSGVHKEVTRLEAAGLITSQRVGRTRLVQADPNSPFHEDLRRLLTKAFGPPALLVEALEPIPGIERAFIYGSWVASQIASGDHAPRDIDVMVLGNPNIEEVYASVSEVETKVGRPINVSVYTEADWAEDPTGFAASVRTSPQHELLG